MSGTTFSSSAMGDKRSPETTVLHMGSIPRAEKSAWVKAARRAGMKVVPWARSQLNAAAQYKQPEDFNGV